MVTSIALRTSSVTRRCVVSRRVNATIVKVEFARSGRDGAAFRGADLSAEDVSIRHIECSADHR